MDNFKIISIIWFFSSTLAGCVIYPHAMDVPLIKEKKDLRIDAGVSSAADVSATVSYGLTEKIAIQGFANYGTDEKYFMQSALGYFKNTGRNNVFEWYTGFGAGYGYTYNDSNPGSLFGNYYIASTQFNFGKLNSRFAHMDYGISLKTGFLRTNLTDHNYFDRYFYEDNFDDFLFPKLNDNSILFQPIAFARFGGERLKFNLKVSGMWIYKFTNKNKKLPVGNYNVGIGLNYYINLKKQN